MTSCNNDFSVDTPAVASVEPVNIVAVQKPVDNCSFLTNGLEFELSLMTSADVTIYYAIQPSLDPAPNSDDLLKSGTKVAMTTNVEFLIDESALLSNTSYTLYAISVNGDGLRSEEVYKHEYTTQVYDNASIIAQVETEFSAAITNNSVRSEWYFSADGSNNLNSNPILVTKVAADTYSFNTIWGDFSFQRFSNPTRPYPATIKINPDYTVTITYNPVTAPYARPSSGTYDPCTKKLELTINWGPANNPASNYPPVYVTTTLELP